MGTEVEEFNSGGAPAFHSAPPKFTSAGPSVLVSADRSAAELEPSASGGFHPAACDQAPMIAGVHCVRFTVERKGLLGAFVGVVGGGFDASSGQRRASWECNEGWMFSIGSGYLVHDSDSSEWEGRPADGEVKQGDSIELLLDVGRQTLAVSLNGEWRGVMVQRGMTNRAGSPVAPLEPPLFWSVDVGLG